MGGLPASLLAQAGQTVTVRPYAGQGGSGPLYGASFEWRCYVEFKRRKVRDSLGEEVLSEATAYGQLGISAPPKSEVTLANGRVATVITVAEHDGRGLPVPSHLELALT